MSRIEQKNRKRTRRQRSRIHAAMDESRRMKRSKKRGTASLDDNMRKLGFTRIGPDGEGLPPEQKFAEIA